MRNIRNFTLSAALLVLASGVPSGMASAQPHPPMPPGGAVFMPGDLHVRIVTEGRPAIRHEERSERPDRNHVWQGGYWHHDGSAWGWNDGRWAARPNRHASWVATRYQRTRGGTRYVPGHWSNERVIYEH